MEYGDSGVKVLQAIVKKGKVLAETVVAPTLEKNSVLIQVVNSCISAGTEISNVQGSGKSILQKAIQDPEKIKKVWDMVKTDGLMTVYRKVKGKLEVGSPTGYSIAGVVIGVGENVTRFKPGDAVAAAGAAYAWHAERVNVPENLVVKKPLSVHFKQASSVAIGSIAMQGVRRANLALGEFGVVFGAGILGLLSIQMLKANGVRVAAIDLDDNRLDLAKEFGAEIVLNAKNEDIINTIQKWSNGYGADAVLFTAATTNSAPLSQAFQMCRRKGKVILVGVVGMQLNREDIYAKELDFQISTSYGPGRYDATYEEKGQDYPYAYVRWTENRNMAEYLRLIENGAINLDKMIQKVFPIAQVTDAFSALQDPISKPLMVLLDYGEFDQKELSKNLIQEKKVIINQFPVKKNIINVALVGAGGFATGVHLPNIAKLKDQYQLRAVMNRTGSKAKMVAQQYHANYITSNFDEILSDPEIDLVFIATRHDSHAQLTLKALEAGKHVFCEKPLATNQAELERIKLFYETSTDKKPVLMVGFNRRFSQYAQEIKKHTDKRINPLFMHYRVNAGFLPYDIWVHENGGRIIGEACHMIDLMTFFTNSNIESISVETLTPKNEGCQASDNKSIILKYKDGSIAVIDYFSVGSSRFPKEFLEVHFDQKTMVLDDYKTLKGYDMKVKELKTATSQKGQLEELVRLYDTLIGKNKSWPIEFWDLIQTTEVSFKIASC